MFFASFANELEEEWAFKRILDLHGSTPNNTYYGLFVEDVWFPCFKGYV